MLHAVALAVVVAATVLAYANAPMATLAFDARTLVAANPAVHDATAANVVYLLTHAYWQPMARDGVYRPMTTLSFLFDYAVLGHADRASAYVVENVALHCTCAVLVYLLVWLLARRLWPALVAALLFAVHPVATEAVTNVVGRADLLATAGVLGGLVCWAGGTGASGGRRAAYAVGLGVSAVIAFFAKESGLVLAGGIVLYDLAFPREPRRVRAEHLVVAGVLAVNLAARWYVERIGLPPQDIAPVDNPIVGAPFVLGRLTAVGVLMRLLGLVVWPATLSIDYSNRAIPVVAWPPASAGDWVALAGLVVLPLLGIALVRVRRRMPAIFFLGSFAALALLPSANLILVIGSIMAERFLYLPLAGIAGAVALAADGWARSPGRRRTATAVVALLVLAAGIRTAVRNRDWRDERTLWEATVRAVPESAKARKGYAGALYEPNGDVQALAQVIVQAEQAVALQPDYEPALVDLAGYCIGMGDLVAEQQPAAAGRWYEKALTALETARPLDERNTARFVEEMRARGNSDDTIPDVGNGILYNNLALANVRRGHLEEALAAYERLRQLAPVAPAVYRDIATIHYALGRTDDAAVTLWEAVALSDDDPEAKQRLVEIYRATASGGEPIVTDGPAGEVTLHTSHPLVQRQRCRAWNELAAIFTRARQPTLAARARDEAASCTGG